MDDFIKIVFNDEDSFYVYYITDKIFEKEDDFKKLFKYINDILIKKYDYEFDGFYDVVIYFQKGIYVLDFEFVDGYGDKDFNVMMYLNSDILYEFEDSEILDCQKIYYKEKYYTEVENVLDDIKLFEYGSIIFGKEVEEVLNNGILIF